MIQELTQRLDESEKDRAARLEVIQDLSRRLQESETDRAARLEVINELQRKNELFSGNLKIIESNKIYNVFKKMFKKIKLIP